MKLEAVGIPWYHKETYRAARALFVDGARFPSRYDDWLKGALEAEARVQANGQTAIRAFIDPRDFRIWCEQRGVPADFSARSAFAHETAHAEYAKRTGPRPAHVVFPDGHAEVGTQVAPTAVDLSSAAVALRLRDLIHIDGRPVSIVAKTVQLDQDGGPEDSSVGAVRITFEELKRS